jgi:hypothetical protein
MPDARLRHKPPFPNFKAMPPATNPLAALHGPRPLMGERLPMAALDRAERIVVHAIRTVGGSSGAAQDDAHLNEKERAVLRELRPAMDLYVQQLPSGQKESVCDPAAPQVGPFELHTLHALACLQAGLLGEAWKSLVPVWAQAEAGKALLRLQEVAEVLQLRGQRIERWSFDPAFLRAAGLI